VAAVFTVYHKTRRTSK